MYRKRSFYTIQWTGHWVIEDTKTWLPNGHPGLKGVGHSNTFTTRNRAEAVEMFLKMYGKREVVHWFFDKQGIRWCTQIL